MPSCAVITCRKRTQFCSVVREGISFHRFPKNPSIRKIWIEATGRNDWIPTKSSTICSEHFAKSDFVTKKSNNRYLKLGATPLSIFTVSDFPVQSNPNDPKKNTVDHLNDPSTPKRNKTMKKQSLNKKISSSPTSDVLTPRKRKLKQVINSKDQIIKRQRLQIKRIQAQNRRLKIKINKVEDMLTQMQEKFNLRGEDISVLKSINLKIQDLSARCAEKTRNVYSKHLRAFALTLHYYSPKAYEYVRQTFDTCLPHRRTLRRWYSSVDGEPGFTRESFLALKSKSQLIRYPIIAGLVMDEMAIRRRIEWDGNKLHGYVEIGSGLDSDYVTEAKEVLVFLVTGINCNFKVPVAYFLVDGVTGAQRAELDNQCLEHIHDTGVKIVSITFDGCASNLAMLHELGCSIENNTFKHPITKTDVVAVLDPSHMVKLLRNAFQLYKRFIDSNGNTIDWIYLQELNRIQEKEKFHLANKLRHQHIEFQNQKMKVKLATQLFSLSVADAIDFCRNDLNMRCFRESEATTTFLRIINNTFDIFNSRSQYQHGFKKALSEKNAIDVFSYLDMAVYYFSCLRCEDGTLVINCPKKLGFRGFIGSAKALKHFYISLIQTKQLIYMPFYKVSQDHLELLTTN